MRGEGDPADPATASPNRGGGLLNPYSVAGRRRKLADLRARLAAAEADAALLAGLTGRADDDPIPGGQADRVLNEVADGEDTPESIDCGFLTAAGVPDEWHDAPGEWGGWTAGAVRAGLGRLASTLKTTPSAPGEKAAKSLAREVAEIRRQLPGLETVLAQKEADAVAGVPAARARACVPGTDTVDKLARYESHLHRQLVQTFHLLERLLNVRAGNPAPPPVAVDVTVEAGGGAAGPAG